VSERNTVHLAVMKKLETQKVKKGLNNDKNRALWKRYTYGTTRTFFNRIHDHKKKLLATAGSFGHSYVRQLPPEKNCKVKEEKGKNGIRFKGA